MMRYVIWGWAEVIDPDDRPVLTRSVLRDLASFVDDEDYFATEFLGGDTEEDRLAAALLPSGRLRFALRDDEDRLRVINEYRSTRPLSDSELACLCAYTLGQWSDGLGECVVVPRGGYKDFMLHPLMGQEAGVDEYPFVEVIND